MTTSDDDARRWWVLLAVRTDGRYFMTAQCVRLAVRRYDAIADTADEATEFIQGLMRDADREDGIAPQ